MLTHCTLAHCTLGPLKLCQGLQCVPLLERRGVGVAFGFPLLSLSCVLSFAVHATLYLRATLVTRGRVAFYMGPPVVPPICNILYLPFIVVQLTLNLTINP